MRKPATAAGIGLVLVLGACTPRAVEPEPFPTRPPPRPVAVDGRSTPVADPVYPQYGNPALDVLHYDLDLAWDPGTRILRGTATLTVRPVRELAEVPLDFAGGYTVEKATVDGAAATPQRRGDDLVLVPGRPLAADRQVAVGVTYRGTPAPVRFPGVRGDVATTGLTPTADGALWTMQEPYGAFTWFPCSDQPSDEALYDIAVTVPPGWVAVANGRVTVQDRTYRWHAAEPIATYLVTLAVDRFDRTEDRTPGGLPVSYWVRESDADRMLPTLRRTPEMIAWLERRLGRYPFSSAGVVVVQSTSGMETQTMVTLGPLAGPGAVPVLLHELAHHWFGNAVTPRTWRDVWLNEGFATYLQGLYTAERLGGDMDAIVRDWRNRDAGLRAEAGPPGSFRADRFAARNVYIGPALMLHELRGLLGDPRFFAMLHDWVQHHLHTSQDRASFTAWLREYTDRADVVPVVDKWLDSPTTPG